MTCICLSALFNLAKKNPIFIWYVIPKGEKTNAVRNPTFFAFQSFLSVAPSIEDNKPYSHYYTSHIVIWSRDKDGSTQDVTATIEK